MKHRNLNQLAFVLLAVLSSTYSTNVVAGLISVSQSAFSGTETVVDFNSPFVNEALLTNDFIGLGVTFSGSLYTMQNPGDTSIFPANGGGQIASNYVYSDIVALQGNVIDIYFASPVNRVGFWRSMWSDDTLTVTAFSGANSLGPVVFAGHDTIVQFTGVEGLDTAFDRIRLDIAGPNNNFLAIDDLRFEASSVPEPASLALFCSGMGIIGVAASRQHRKRLCDFNRGSAESLN